MHVEAANSFSVLALLSTDMDEGERAAVWTLVRYLREKEIRGLESGMERALEERTLALTRDPSALAV